MKIGFIGLGIIGGSIAKALRKYYPESHIVACDPDKESLAHALTDEIVDTVCTEVNDNFRNCDYIFLCAPVSLNINLLEQVKPYLEDSCILTDVGSVKTTIHRMVEQLDMESYFIGGHPMAGSEKSGYAHSKAHLIENAYYILTPSKLVAPTKIQALQELVTSLKSIPIRLDYQEHDQITGTISHLPHIIASSLVNIVHDLDGQEEHMKTLAAGGFKDITRIASSSATMWQQICLENKDAILPVLDRYIEYLQQARQQIETSAKEQIFQLFDDAQNYRDSISDVTRGPIQKSYIIFCDITDEPGGIAIISTILASNNVNIKNIGIINNREYVEGALFIEFYDSFAYEMAKELLKRHGYQYT